LNVVELAESNSVERHLEIVQDALREFCHGRVKRLFDKLRVSHGTERLPVVRESLGDTAKR
jgi:hypothetical protein